jgi:hypothetical protein
MPPKKEPAAAAAAGPAYTPEQQAERLLLIEECKRLRDLRLQEQSDFSALGEEREKLNSLWASSKKQLEDAKAELREKDRLRQELVEEQGAEIKVRIAGAPPPCRARRALSQKRSSPPSSSPLQLHKQRIKHLLFEQHTQAVEKQADGKVALKLAQETQVDSERELKADVRDLKVSPEPPSPSPLSPLPPPLPPSPSLPASDPLPLPPLFLSLAGGPEGAGAAPRGAGARAARRR